MSEVKLYIIFIAIIIMAVFSVIRKSRRRTRTEAFDYNEGMWVRSTIDTAASGGSIPEMTVPQGEVRDAALTFERSTENSEMISERAARSGGLKDEKSLGSIKDDRKGDWLARQLKEEAALARKSKYDLGGAHDISCDAKRLKLSHRHDNTIDNGET